MIHLRQLCNHVFLKDAANPNLPQSGNLSSRYEVDPSDFHHHESKCNAKKFGESERLPCKVAKLGSQLFVIRMNTSSSEMI